MNLNTKDFRALDAYIAQEMQALHIKGVAISVVQGHKVVHRQGFGEGDPSGRAITPQTPFIIGSTSKSFTALAVMQLVEQGKVALDAPVQRYLPWFQVADPRLSASITVSQLLFHTSGLSSLTAVGSGVDTQRTLEQQVHNLNTVIPRRPGGKVFEYANQKQEYKEILKIVF